MFGGKLTTRQWSVLMKISADEGEQAMLDKVSDFEQQKKNKDLIRVSEEVLESHRRHQVLSGAWTEADSHTLL